MTGLVSIARAARPVRIGVVGDLIIDRYLTGDADRISPEAPIPVLSVMRDDVRLGGAGNVVANLLAIHAEVWVGGAVGTDENGAALIQQLARAGAATSAVVRDPARPTVEKTRLIARSQQILRFDREDTTPLVGEAEQALVAAVTAAARDSDMIIASDYAKGTLTPRVFAALVGSGRPVIVDPKGRDYSKYRGAYGITPNRAEAEAATGVKIRGDQSMREAAGILMEIVQAQVVLITLGEDGIYCASRDGSDFHFHTEARKVFDVTGAGDTVIALLARFLAADIGLPEAVRIANAGAGVVVGKLGAVTVSPDELMRALGARGEEDARKVLTREEAPSTVVGLKNQGQKVVFTNGCFDLLHAGHVRYLSLARAQGDVLIVGLNDDASVTALKGPTRPLMTWEDRAEVLAGLSAVDYVVPFHEDTPLELIRALTPDVLMKGEDWRNKGVVGREWVEEHGGRVHLAPLVEGRSTSNLVDRIRQGTRAASDSESA